MMSKVDSFALDVPSALYSGRFLVSQRNACSPTIAPTVMNKIASLPSDTHSGLSHDSN
jgi:hypothetical protein